MKLKLQVVAAQAKVQAEPPKETPLQAARRRYGKPFAFEVGAQFKWTSGATVLDKWKAKRFLAREGK